MKTVYVVITSLARGLSRGVSIDLFYDPQMMVLRPGLNYRQYVIEDATLRIHVTIDQQATEEAVLTALNDLSLLIRTGIVT